MSDRILHPIPPTWDSRSRILILGSFPSVKSRETAYFYGHPQNRYWKVLAALFGEAVPETVEERRSFLLRRHIAAWDVIASCRITGSSDSSIRDAEVNDLRPILEADRTSGDLSAFHQSRQRRLESGTPDGRLVDYSFLL